MHHALDANQGHPIIFSNHAGDEHLLATMKDVVERMASASGRPIKWEGNHFPRMKRTRVSRGCRISMLGRLACMPQRSVRREEAILADVVSNSTRAIFICCSREEARCHA